MQILHFSLTFLTITTLASQSGYVASRMKSIVRSLSTSSSITFCLSGVKCRFFYLTDLTFGLMLSRWVITSEGISDLSVVNQVKILIFALSKFTSYCRSRSDSCDPIWIIFSRSSFFNGIETSCLAGSPLSWFFFSLICRQVESFQVYYFGWRQRSSIGQAVDLHASLQLHFSSKIGVVDGMSKPLLSDR